MVTATGRFLVNKDINFNLFTTSSDDLQNSGRIIYDAFMVPFCCFLLASFLSSQK